MSTPSYPEEYLNLIAQGRSVMLSTLNTEGITQCSYAPVVHTSPTEFFILISDLASHTAYIKSAARVGILFIEDEKTCENIFRRRRASLSCDVIAIDRSSTTFKLISQSFRSRHGDTVDIILKLADFHLFKLTAYRIRLITGFGQAKDLEIPNLV